MGNTKCGFSRSCVCLRLSMNTKHILLPLALIAMALSSCYPPYPYQPVRGGYPDPAPGNNITSGEQADIFARLVTGSAKEKLLRILLPIPGIPPPIRLLERITGWPSLFPVRRDSSSTPSLTTLWMSEPFPRELWSATPTIPTQSTSFASPEARGSRTLSLSRPCQIDWALFCSPLV